MEKITADMNVCEVLDLDPEIETIFLKHGLNCVGCPGSNTENLSEAAEGHGIDLAILLADLNKHLAEA